MSDELQSARLQELAKQEKDFRNAYCGKKVSLIGSQLMWSVGCFTLNRMNAERKDAHTAIVPNELSFKDLNTLHFAIQDGTLALTDNLNANDKEALLNAKEEPINDPSFVEAMEDIDDLLHTSPDKLAEKLRSLEGSKRLTRDFFARLLEEEKTSKNRKEYIEVIEKFA